MLDENYTITKDKNIKYQTRSNQTFDGKRVKKQLGNRELAYLATRVAIDAGMRPGNLRKLQ